MAPSARSAGVALILFPPVVLASEAGTIAAVCLTGAEGLGVDVTSPSLPTVCLHVATILVLS